MKVMLSAYACEPEKGSEPAVGWAWVNQLCKKGFDLHVITRSNNRASIELYSKVNPNLRGVSFHYFDLHPLLMKLKKGKNFVHLYYIIWQIFVYFKVRRLHKKHRFDVIHHVTFVTGRLPSFLSFINAKVVLGPLAGGENAPFRLRRHYSIKEHLVEVIRGFANFMFKYDPLSFMCFRRASYIFVTSDCSKQLVRESFWNKTSKSLAIAIDPPSSILPEKKQFSGRFLYVGNLIGLKGISILILAFSRYIKDNPTAILTVVGNGSRKSDLVRLASEQGASDNILWIDQVPRSVVNKYYQENDVLLFPSLRDSGGMVVLEALSYGMPAICLKLGGPGEIVDKRCGFALPVEGRKYNQVICDMTDAMKEISTGSHFRDCSNGALEVALEHSWEKLVDKIVDRAY